MTTMTVCKSAAVCGNTWIIQTICATGSGDSFSNCNSTIASVSSKLLRGSSMTRRNTFSGGNHATFNRGCHRERHDLATRLKGNDSPGAPACSRLNAKPPPLASNCQRRFASGPTCRMLQNCQRAMGEFLIYDF